MCDLLKKSLRKLLYRKKICYLCNVVMIFVKSCKAVGFNGLSRVGDMQPNRMPLEARAQ